MKITGLDGREYSINLGKYSLRMDDRERSDLFRAAVSVVKQVYPSDPLCAEVYLEGAANKLYLDLYLPARRLAIEVQGAQHFQYTRHMHGTKLNFGRSKGRDREKRELLELNDITLIYFNYDEKDQWQKILKSAFLST